VLPAIIKGVNTSASVVRSYGALRARLRRLVVGVVSGCLSLALAACYSGGEREKEAPNGYPGGLCIDDGVTAPACEDALWICVDGEFCMDPDDPCNGVFCGGAGECNVNDQDVPYCLCDVGFNNERYYLVCEDDAAGATIDPG
jgi:hypothetical protein